MATSETPSPLSAAHLHTLVEQLNALGAYLRYSTLPPAQLPYDVLWCQDREFRTPESASQQTLQNALTQQGFGACRKAQAASLMLRYGWAAGFRIGAWLTHQWVVTQLQQTLAFNREQALLSGLSVQSCSVLRQTDGHTRSALQARLAQTLVESTAPVVAAYHRWSGLSEAALWSMICSAWAAHFIAICERRQQPELALHEAQQVFVQHPITQAFQPELYTVTTQGKIAVCQRRHLCCLWFKSSPQCYCHSCPILPAQTRMASNLQWVADHGTVIPALGLEEQS